MARLRQRRPVSEIRGDIATCRQKITLMRETLQQLAEEMEQHREKDRWDLFDDLSVERHTDDPGSLPASYRLHGLIKLMETESLGEIDSTFTELEQAFEEILTLIETDQSHEPEEEGNARPAGRDTNSGT